MGGSEVLEAVISSSEEDPFELAVSSDSESPVTLVESTLESVSSEVSGKHEIGLVPDLTTPFKENCER